jgi:hypothetical protein
MILIHKGKSPVGIILPVKIRRTDTTLDLSHLAKRAGEEKFASSGRKAL